MPSSTCSTTLDLHTARSLYAALTLRACKAFGLVKRFQALSVAVDRRELANTVAHAVYYNASFAAYENYSDESELAEVLLEEYDQALPRDKGNTDDGAYVLSPFFNGRLNRECNLHGSPAWEVLNATWPPDNLAALDVQPLILPAGQEPLSGVLPAEMDILTQHYLSRSRAIVSAMRSLHTVLLSGRSRMERGAQALGVAQPACLLWDELASALELPVLPVPSSMRGTESDRTNPVRVLPEAFVRAMLSA